MGWILLLMVHLPIRMPEMETTLAIISLLGLNTRIYVLTRSLDGQRVVAVYHLRLPVSAFGR